MIIKVKRISPRVSRQDIENLFDTYGDVKNVIMTPRSAYVNMPDRRRAQLAIDNLNGMNWKGGRINLRKYKSTEDKSVCRTSLGMFRMI